MKKQLLYILGILMTLQVGVNTKIEAATRTWNGSVNNSWFTAGNWNSGVPDSTDNIIVNSNAPYNLTLTQNHKVASFTINGDTLDLGGYTLTITGTCTFNGGKTTTGIIKPIGTLCHFGGGIIDSRIEANCGYYHMNGGSFLKPTIIVSTSYASSTGAGNCIFSDSLTITHSGVYYFTMGSTNNDIFNGPVTIVNSSTHELYLATGDTSYFNNNLIINNLSTGGVVFGNTGGVSYLASGKTISIGSSGFTDNYLTLKNFYQLGTTAQTLTLTGTAIVNCNNANFNGNLTVTAPGILLKNSTFNGTTTLTRNGSSGNFHSDGGNLYNNSFTIDNSGSSGRIRLASTTADTYNGSATFNSSGGQDVQVGYSGNNIFEGNVTINSNKVVFNTASGKVTFSGGNSQSLNGSYNYPFKKLAINKSSNHVTANTTLSVDDTLFFVSKNLITTATNLLTMKAGSVANGASNSSFVSGPVKKVGSTGFQFPVGKNSVFRKVEITAPSNATDAFTAEYFDTTQTSGSTMDTTITFISDCGYWSLNRNTGSSNITPKFAFDSTHCDYLSVKPVHIAFWDGTKWVDKGEGVNDSNTKKTSAAVTSYGNFALSYKLIPGDAPQMPYVLTSNSTCSPVEMLFENSDLWFSFEVDSALIKLGLFTPDPNKWYAPIKELVLYEKYIPGSDLTYVQDWQMDCDSALFSFQTFSTDLDTSKKYLAKFSKYEMVDCDGISDTTNYYLNICLRNLRMYTGSTTYYYNSAGDLEGYLGTPGSVGSPGTVGSTNAGDVLVHGAANLRIDLTNVAPLVIDGVILTGDYDLIDNPEGTLLFSYNTGLFIPPPDPDAGLVVEGYMFVMRPGGEIQNIRLRGAMPGLQDYNQDRQLCAALRLEENSATNSGFLIQNCEIDNFSYGGIFASAGVTDVRIDYCYIHHVQGTGGGDTPGKGYGVWIQGAGQAEAVGNEFTITNSIFDESKAAIDAQPNPANVTVENCTFGNYFLQETINKHSFGDKACLPCDDYDHPAGSGCDYYEGSTQISTSSIFNINEPGAGHTSITKSIFYQPGKVITLPYPVNPYETTNTPRYNINITENIFVEKKASESEFPDNFGGYARINDNYVEDCVWDWDREHDILNNATFTDPVIKNEPNNFLYTPGKNMTIGDCTTCPQPPEVQMTFTDVEGFLPGFNSNSDQVAYINQGDDLEITLNTGSLGSDDVVYIVRSHPNNGSAIDENESGENAYDTSQVTLGPTSSPATVTFGPSTSPVWNTNNPGLYGLDVLAVDASLVVTNYNASQSLYKPIIVAPSSNYMLIFNIKDSYFADLYGSVGLLTPGEVFKQVELNGHVIWREDVLEGGDNWEQVQINLFTQLYDGTPIKDFFDTKKLKQQLTFSISINVNSSNVNNTSNENLRGIYVWVDDVYLKKYDSPENLISDGGIEHTTKSGLTTSPTVDDIWYVSKSIVYNNCYSLDYGFDPNHPTNPDPITPDPNDSRIASTKARVDQSDRKSGSQSIVMRLPGLHNTSVCNTYNNLDLGENGEVVSTAVDFDFRDFMECAAMTSLDTSNAGYNGFIHFPSGNLTDINGIAITKEYENYYINENCTLKANNGYGYPDHLILKGCQIVVLPHDPPWQIIVENGATLEIKDNNNTSPDPDEIAPSRIFACGDMWGGIKNIGGDVIIYPHADRPTEIYDAKTAIESDGGSVNIRFALFDHNYIGLNLKNGSFFHGNPVNGQGIIGIDFKCTGGKIMKVPWIGEPSNTHILLEDVIQVQIGSSGGNGYSYTNTFADAVYGIKSIDSDNIIIINNNFSDMQNFSEVHPCVSCGTSIYAENHDVSTYNLTIGGAVTTTASTEYLKNTFQTSKMGIFTRGKFNLTIKGNLFEDLVQGVRINRTDGMIEINDENIFDRVTFGIFGFYLENTVKINNNIFTIFDPSVESADVDFFNTAITLQNPVTPFASNTVSIFDNEITNYRIGIHAINISATTSLGVGYDNSSNTVSGNVIHYTITDFPLPRYHGGIWLQNCLEAKVFGNQITNTVFNKDDNFRGIDIESSLNCDVNCNNIDKLGIAINFDGHCDETQLRQNLLNDFDIGINLNNSKIDLDQGTAGAPSNLTAWDNLWTMTTGNTCTYKVGGNTLDQSKINWFHQGLNNPSESWSPNPFPSQLVLPDEDETSTGDACTTTVANFNERVVYYGPIVGDSAAYTENSDENHYLANVIAYYAMKTDSTIIYQGDSLDADFEAYFTRHDTSNIGKLYLVESLMDREPDSAMTIVDNLEPANAIEIYLLEHYQRSQDILERGGDLSASDSAFYMERTTGTSITQGVVYYYGLGSLFIEKHPAITSSRIGQQTIIESLQSIIDSKTDLAVFPNPSTGAVRLKLSNPEMVISIAEIYNSMGENLFYQRIEQNSLQVDMSSFGDGIYFARCKDTMNRYYIKSFYILK